jgi:hypothetical protein
VGTAHHHRRKLFPRTSSVTGTDHAQAGGQLEILNGGQCPPYQFHHLGIVHNHIKENERLKKDDGIVKSPFNVIPAKAGIQKRLKTLYSAKA